jgi:hypothetical protein
MDQLELGADDAFLGQKSNDLSIDASGVFCLIELSFHMRLLNSLVG